MQSGRKRGGRDLKCRNRRKRGNKKQEKKCSKTQAKNKQKEESKEKKKERKKASNKQGFKGGDVATECIEKIRKCFLEFKYDVVKRMTDGKSCLFFQTQRSF
jgi:hypothetical protein